MIRARGTTSVKYDATVEFLLQPGDIVQIGSLFPHVPEMTVDRHPERRRLKAGSRRAKATAARPAASIN